MLLNGACLKTWSTTQSVIAVSSGEAEYYAALKGANMPLGFRSMAADLGEDVKIVLRSDSSAALGIGGRQGLGKLRHLEIAYLWLQDVLAQRRLSIKKVKGKVRTSYNQIESFRGLLSPKKNNRSSSTTG